MFQGACSGIVLYFIGSEVHEHFYNLIKVGMGRSIKFLKETKAGRLLVVVNRCLLAFTMHVS
jgi:hypothetical protein